MPAPLLKLRSHLSSLVVAVMVATAGQTNAIELKSPDGRLVVSFAIQGLDGTPGCPVYDVTWDEQPIILPSRLALELADTPLRSHFKVLDTVRSSHESTWHPVCGERSQVRDHHHQLLIHLEETKPPGRRLDLTFRAYDTGVAFCYTVPQQEPLQRIQITREHTEFRLPGDPAAWAVYSAQGKYSQVPVSQIRSGCERPLPIRLNENLYAALAEARLVDYARMKFGPLSGAVTGLASELAGPVEAKLPLTTPWRVIMVANRPGQWLENNDLLLNLNDPCALKDTSWIRPGKVIREVTLTTQGGKACVDFAVRRNLQYVLFDAGWYGHEYSDDSDATTVTVDPKRSKGPLDLHEVIRYARERDVGIILYVNQRALAKQLDEILPLYRQWGVQGVKYGFVHVGSQQWTTWLHEAIRKAADHQLMVDIHDEYRPTGYQRTYPNLMTAEGIAGDETTPANANTLTILFSRSIAGPADNTVCYYDPRVPRMASHAYQLAKAVCIYSPWQFLFWYDRPPQSPSQTGGAGGSNPGIGEEPELEFFAALPTVWDDTRVLHGEIGVYAVIARRSGSEWFLGAMNSGQSRSLEVPLDFLPPEVKYTAHIYSDDPAVPTRTHVRIDRVPVDASTTLKCALGAQGGQAIRLTPARLAAPSAPP